MRPDMAKILVERPRLKNGTKKGYNKNTSLEDLPTQESMKRPHIGHEKSLNENLKPLERFLRTNCGRPWDEVYSEISKHMRLDSACQYHILQHLNMMVEKNTIVENGEIYYHASLGWGGGAGKYPIKDCYHKFYICPKTKKLCYNKDAEHRKYRYKKKEYSCYKAVGKNKFVKIDGIWYVINFVKYNKYWEIKNDTYFDPVLAEIKKQTDYYYRKDGHDGYCQFTAKEIDNFYGTTGLAGRKGKQLNKTELKRAGLVNDK